MRLCTISQEEVQLQQRCTATGACTISRKLIGFQQWCAPSLAWPSWMSRRCLSTCRRARMSSTSRALPAARCSSCSTYNSHASVTVAGRFIISNHHHSLLSHHYQQLHHQQPSAASTLDTSDAASHCNAMLCIDTLTVKIEKKKKRVRLLASIREMPEGKAYWGCPCGGSQLTLAINQAFADLLHLLMHIALVCSQLLGHGGVLGLSCRAGFQSCLSGFLQGSLLVLSNKS